jgi:hypothetical protein
MPIAKQWFSVVRNIKDPKEKECSTVNIEPKDFRDVGQYKFVRFSNDQVKFCVTTDMNETHKRIVDSQPDWTPVSAGKIFVRNGCWNIVEKGSWSAKLGGLDDDKNAIQKNLGGDFLYDSDLQSW